MEKQIPLIEIELLCSECKMPLAKHTNTQLSNCDSLRRIKENQKRHAIIETQQRKQLITKLKG